jgi:hypothetical protein
MTPTLWTFSAYVTPAGGRIVQEWYDGLPEEEHDELQDTFNYLSITPDWRRPEFDKVRPPLHEVRAKANQANHWVRVYGIFGNVRREFVLLYGNQSKKTGHDAKGQQVAIDRHNLLKSGKASKHGFAI